MSNKRLSGVKYNVRTKVSGKSGMKCKYKKKNNVVKFPV